MKINMVKGLRLIHYGKMWGEDGGFFGASSFHSDDFVEVVQRSRNQTTMGFQKTTAPRKKLFNCQRATLSY